MGNLDKIFTKSENYSQEYCATFVKLGEIQEIPDARTVAKTNVNGRTIIISKERKEGDIMIYCSNESQLNADFCFMNNLYSDINLNSNSDEVYKWLSDYANATEDEKHIYLLKHKGYFDNKCRVRMKKLAGEISMGILFEPEVIENWCPNLSISQMNLEEMIDKDFDTVNGELFIKAYVPERKDVNYNTDSRATKRNKRLKKFDRMIPGQFVFHYDTSLLERNISRFKPDTEVTISNKLHGTSFIIGNVLVKQPLFNGWYSKIFNYLPKFLQFTKNGYDVVYSSRSVIKNSDINPNKRGYSKGLDACFDKYYEILKGWIPKNITVYGEIVGYCEGSNSYIQTVGKGYDYKCKPGENKFMIYRVTETDENGLHREYEIDEVLSFTERLRDDIRFEYGEEMSKRIIDLQILYQGKMGDLYPELDTTNHWRENVLECLKNDKEHFGMEENEPMCRSKVPREGIVIRIANDPIKEAFKLKCLKFLGKEAQEVDKGNVDAEMESRY